MKTENTCLAETLRQIAFEAGCALLRLGPAGSVPHCTARFNRLYLRLCTLAPNAACIDGPLPPDASAAAVRMAARDAALRVRMIRAACPCHRLAA